MTHDHQPALPMPTNDVASTSSAIRGDLTVFPVFLTAIAGLLLLGQAVFLREFSSATSFEKAVVMFSVLMHTVTLIAAVILALGVAAKRLPPPLVRWLWSTALVASSLYCWDYFGYGWLGLHLGDSIPMLYWSARSDFAVMGDKLAMMAGGLLVLVLTWFGAPFLSPRRVGGIIWHEATVSGRWAMALLIVSFGLLTIQQASIKRLLTRQTQSIVEQAVRQLSVLPGTQRAEQIPMASLLRPTLRQLPTEKMMQAELAAITPHSFTRTPNIFLFVVDSLRSDAATPEVMPNLARLRETRGIPISQSVANANCTHISWTVLANAQPPYLWSALVHQRERPGALPLRLLKQGGYGIKLWSSAVSSYMGFGTATFGNGHPLLAGMVDQELLLRQGVPPVVGELDAEVMRRLEAEVETLQPNARTLHYVLLDSPHHGYSWAQGFVPKFLPFAENVPAISAQVNSRNVHLLRNRYLNSVSFVDGLLGHFLARLEARGLLENSLIIVTGDHGEEFLEHGHLVHSSELNRYQLRVPIVISLPRSVPRPPPVELASHMDVFPTVLDILGWRPAGETPFIGVSLLQSHSSRTVLSSMCAAYTASLYQVDDGQDRLRIRLRKPVKIGKKVATLGLDAMAVLDDRDDEVLAAPATSSGVLGTSDRLFQAFQRDYILR